MKNSEVLLLKPYLRYKKFIEDCRCNLYDTNMVLHKHHIIAKNLGGSNEKSNIVKLSVDDHITAHLLLASCFLKSTKEKNANLRSARILNKHSIKNLDILTSITESYKGKNNPFYGKTHSEVLKQRIRESNITRLSGKTYNEIYGSDSQKEKEKRKNAVKNHWNSMTDSEKKIRSNNISIGLSNIDRAGGNNSFAKKIQINDMVFNSISEACSHFNLTRYKLFKKFIVTYLN